MKMLEYESKVQEDFTIINVCVCEGGGQAQLTEDGREEKAPRRRRASQQGYKIKRDEFARSSLRHTNAQMLRERATVLVSLVVVI